MMPFAQALVISGVNKQIPVAPKRPDVINRRGKCSDPELRAFPAKRLTQQLPRAKFLPPDREQIPAMPLRRLSSRRCLWFVRWTVPVPSQLSASGMQARSQCLLCHPVLRHVGPAFGSGLSPPGKTKACADTNRRSGSCGTGTQAQALVDIHDGLHPAVLAVNHKRRCPSLWIEPKDFAAPTPRTHQPSVLCNQSTTLFFRHEPFRAPFFKMCVLFNYISSSY